MVGTPYLVASGSGLGANPVLTVANATQPGDSIFVYGNTSNSLSAVSDSKGNTYLVIFNDTANGVSMYASTYNGSPGTPTAALTTSDTITGTCTGVSGNALIAGGCSGLAAQAANANTGAVAVHGTSTASSCSFTPTNTGDLVIFGQAFAGAASTVTYTNSFAKIEIGR